VLGYTFAFVTLTDYSAQGSESSSFYYSNTGGNLRMLERLFESQKSPGSTFTHITDPRIVANGFDVKCWRGGLFIYIYSAFHVHACE
jgi:hypothetical protein